MKHFLLCLSLLLFFSATSLASGTIVISSCTDANINNTYAVHAIPVNGKPSYTNGSDLIQWSGSEWRVTINGTLVLTNTADTPFPPCSAQFAWTPTGSGDTNCNVDGPDCSQVLPVELTDFSATKTGNNITLAWETATELNNMGFDVERSTDGVNWEYLDFVEGHGTTLEVQYYTFVDDAPLNGTNYYRLVQIDYDMTATLTDVVSVEFGQQVTSLSIYPVPVKDVLNFDLPTETGSVSVQVYTTMGQLVRQEIIAIDTRNRINLEDLSNGIYLLQVEANGQRWTNKFVKL